jgi:hypothetical protein
LDNITIAVIEGLAVGIAFVVALAFVIDSSPRSTPISAIDQPLYPLPRNQVIPIEETSDDVDGCCDDIEDITFDHELKVPNEQDEIFKPTPPEDRGCITFLPDSDPDSC